MISKIIAEEKIQQVKKLIEKYERFVIITHTSPDGDAIGSSLGLFHFLTEIDKQVSVIVPNQFPTFLSWMDGASDIIIYDQSREYADMAIKEADVIFFLDFNTLNRIDIISPVVLQSGAKRVMVDHHPYPEDFCDITISYPQLSSTGELVFRLICRMGHFEDINLSSAEAVYVAMMTDTGAFTYNSESPEIYIIIAELIKLGVQKDRIYQKVFHTNTVDRTKLMGYAISDKLSIYSEWELAIIALEKDELDKFNAQKGDTEGFVNIPLSIIGIRYSVFLREDDDKIKLSFRSKGNYPVNKIAADYFNGGGHANAAGGEFVGTMVQATQLLIKVMPDYLVHHKV